ncbi:syntaxin-binding protein 5 isoform X1 [Anopheles gambiae]|uniref:V-SNARE coiled-coil homology domain-containing protein n=1 Tax=Anopheles coluzzii TaxID=1518534 RepID=A0A6E8V804_ANOCL|nr:syntaxin-binding protein 5 isoform X1 [Anopheles coluzzii]XP_049464135.1 syntaxin-binding protein 5 isoform X1 [Anopheles coluzzii]XP_061510196.1 syntaxin-binding protein 5 isoform X1 [Anopheles gambiae]XP_061510203.1 syntaxin-binding protein 5 isoform X1 [Anopheles gambiae]XP_311151.6 syntaxin-binding protein 5 isoform X1 [Anopheles gambiae]
MKKFTFKGVLDGFRSSVNQQSAAGGGAAKICVEQEIQETLRSEHFQLKKTFRHGFPYSPTALAFDPVQRILAVGDKFGSMRLLGKFGVDAHVKHEGESACAVNLIEFLVNEGCLVTATADDTLHLWNFHTKIPKVVQSLKFQRERISRLHLPIGTKWLYIGTEKGNTHIVHVDSFTLSGYVINWNKAIDPIRKTHPGAVVHLSDNPLDANKLLIGFESGQLVLWDMRGKCAEFRWLSQEPLSSCSWHHEGKHFITSHTDGSLCTWPLKLSPKPLTHSFPHAKTNKEGKTESCNSIQKVEVKTNRIGDQFTIFSGGLPTEKCSPKSHCITVMVQGKSTTVLEMEHSVVDFVTMCESPWGSDLQEPYAVAVLLQNDLVLIDLLTPGYPTFESPYSMDLHESQITCCTYLADCPSDLVPAFYSVGRSAATNRRSGYSEREWPINGGEWQPTSCSYSEIILTGHQDGSIKFWDSSAGTLQVLYKLKTSKIFEKPRVRSMDSGEEDPLAISMMSLCAESRKLCVACNCGYVVLFKFRRAESTGDIVVLDIPFTMETFTEFEGSPECEFIPKSLPKTVDSTESDKKNCSLLKVKTGPQRKPPGFQAQLVCVPSWACGSVQITALTINSNYGLMAYGNEYGLTIVDIVKKTCVLNLCTQEMYGAQDPYSRTPRSPKRLENSQSKDDSLRSPSIDQPSHVVPEAQATVVVGPVDEAASPSLAVPPCPTDSPAVPLAPVVTFATCGGPSGTAGIVATERKEEGLEQESKPNNVIIAPGGNQPTQEEPPPSLGLVVGVLAMPPEGLGQPPPALPLPPLPPATVEEEEPAAVAAAASSGIAAAATPAQRRAKKSFIESLPLPKWLRSLNKLDNSFSRSRSSSMSSLENNAMEAVTCLAFADSYVKKSDPSMALPTAWLGTSLGSILTISLSIPENDLRKANVVQTAPTGAMFRLKGSILSMSLLDCNGALIPYSFESWREDSKDSKEKRERTPTKTSSTKMSPTNPDGLCDRQFIAIASEKQAGVFALPSQNCVYRKKLVDFDFIVKAEIISMKDSVCLICYASNGHLMVFTLPSLKPLLEVDFLPLADLSFQTKCKQGVVDPMLSIWGQQLIVNEDSNVISRTFSFSNKGHGLYLATPTEIQKFTVCQEFSHQYNNMLGDLYVPHEMPEAPKESFFKGLFGGGMRNLDREELFGESSGKANRSVAKHIPGPNADIQALNARTTSVTSEIGKAHQLMLERGDKLSQLEERTERMANEAQQFSSSAHLLMNKYKDKKWYQL